MYFLVIEDERALCETIVRSLRRQAYSVDSFSNSIRVHISALRKKLRAVLGYDPIRNRIGEGYLMGGEEV